MIAVGKSFTRRQFLGASGASLASSLAATGSAEAASTDEAKPAGRRPNIILFMPDERRADAVACFGNPVVKTPNLDRLASQGTRFANCSVLYPVCGASRCSLLTGWPTSMRRHRSLFYFLRPEEPNLFGYLKQNGYDVFRYGKNDALAAQSFCDSVTYWNQPAPLALRPRSMQLGLQIRSCQGSVHVYVGSQAYWRLSARVRC